MRVLPEFEATCHICGHTHTVRNIAGYEEGKRFCRQEPAACPRCGAPLRFRPDIGIGGAWDMLFHLFGSLWHRREFGSFEALIGQFALNERELDAYLELIESLDYDAWERQARALSKKPPSRQDKKELAIIREARAAAEKGTLMPKLRKKTASSRERFQAEREQYLPSEGPSAS